MLIWLIKEADFWILRLHIVYTETNLGSVFWMEGKNEEIYYMSMFKEIELYYLWSISEEIIVKKMNSKDHKFMFVAYKVSSKVHL